MQLIFRCLLWFIDLLSMLLTRRFVHVLLDALQLLPQCERLLDRLCESESFVSASVSAAAGSQLGLLVELVRILQLYTNFQIDDATGDSLDDTELDRLHCKRINRLQIQVFTRLKDDFVARDFATSNVASIETRESLAKWLNNFKTQQLYDFAVYFKLIPAGYNLSDAVTEGKQESLPLPFDLEQTKDEPVAKKAKVDDAPSGDDVEGLSKRVFQSCVVDKNMLIKIFLHHFAKRQSHLEEINSISLYPSEELIWDEGRVPMEFYSGEECLALPKLGLQFLTLHDYLLKNFNLFRLETAFEIKQDLEDSVKRLKPWAGEQGQAVFDGWSRMALPIQSFSMIEVAKPALGTKQPARVRADVRVTLVGLREESQNILVSEHFVSEFPIEIVRREWEQLRRHDPVFLLTIRPTRGRNAKHDPKESFPLQYGVVYVRGCEIEGVVDQEGKLIPDEERFGLIPAKGLDAKTYAANSPTWRVRLDAAQYQADQDKLHLEQANVTRLKDHIARAKREARSAEFISRLQNQLAVAEQEVAAAEDIYDTFNVLVRRKPKENNFKAVLETIRDLMNTRSVVPDWLQDLLMGYLDPAEAHYTRQVGHYQTTQNWFDTFLSETHVRAAFPQYQVCMVSERAPGDLSPPFRLEFPELVEDSTAKVEAMMPSDQLSYKEVMESQKKSNDLAQSQRPKLTVFAQKLPTQPPTKLEIKKPGNMVPFTPRQVEAIRSGMQFGLTMVVGPPGTGKTDVAVQIIHNLYHNYPNQRILIVTHSNQALNQLFEKIIALNVDERHLLRLGHGEEGLNTDKDFSRYGRVDYILKKRLQLLKEVMRLSKTLISADLPSAAAIDPEQDVEGFRKQVDKKSLTKEKTEDLQMYSCETAQYFFVQTVLALWEQFIAETNEVYSEHLDPTKEADYDATALRKGFPFTEYFLRDKEPSSQKMDKFLPGKSFLEDMEICRACFRHLHSIFTRLDEFRAFELMRNGVERANYLLVQEAKIVAMTCTHAALRRRDLVQLGFTYDTIIMEEAAQILEIETFIPLLLQNPDISGQNRLKRWIMIGDHNQLPPVVKNQAFNNYSNMGQSLFTRLIKLGVPTVNLDAQGRARPSLSRLYSWRYEKLADLPHVSKLPRFVRSNAGFQYECQIINVEDYMGVGESEPSAFFYQNLAEAEYLVATYMYMRILGYPAERISVLTTYNGQKHLLRDVLEARCAENPLLGMPDKVTTVDRFQGQQNDYILVSLVRTRTVGYLRDIRRLIVALSRARLGLYIFARVAQFSSCQELRPAFDRLLGREPGSSKVTAATKLHLTPWERFSDEEGRQLGEQLPQPATVIEDMTQMTQFVKQLYEERVKELMARLPGAPELNTPMDQDPDDDNE
ncbi:hypothetical protein Ciccas_011048 [Cichlidogyrus casuarinus]|uniref:Intron-binding protein aquarius n=1 Tax=Cichlidogyrus casuarinus TaxID=1844966 RepID=A0ABD2PSC5_9PLAT